LTGFFSPVGFISLSYGLVGLVLFVVETVISNWYTFFDTAVNFQYAIITIILAILRAIGILVSIIGITGIAAICK
jgi:hypothetical protein